MTEHCYWRFSRALHRAINDQCFAEIEDLLDKHVEWALNGPIDMFPFLGSRHGKHAVLKVIRHLAGNIQVRRFDREMTILGLDSAASICAVRLVTVLPESQLCLAQFAQFKAARLINMRALSTRLISSSRSSAALFTCRTSVAAWRKALDRISPDQVAGRQSRGSRDFAVSGPAFLHGVVGCRVPRTDVRLFFQDRNLLDVRFDPSKTMFNDLANLRLESRLS